MSGFMPYSSKVPKTLSAAIINALSFRVFNLSIFFISEGPLATIIAGLFSNLFLTKLPIGPPLTNDNMFLMEFSVMIVDLLIKVALLI